MNKRHEVQPNEMDHIALVFWRITGSLAIGALWIWALESVA